MYNYLANIFEFMTDLYYWIEIFFRRLFELPPTIPREFVQFRAKFSKLLSTGPIERYRGRGIPFFRVSAPGWRYDIAIFFQDFEGVRIYLAIGPDEMYTKRGARSWREIPLEFEDAWPIIQMHNMLENK